MTRKFLLLSALFLGAALAALRELGRVLEAIDRALVALDDEDIPWCDIEKEYSS